MADNNKQYGIIHELGDYSSFQQLNEEDNKNYQQQLLREQEQKRQLRENSQQN